METVETYFRIMFPAVELSRQDASDLRFMPLYTNCGEGCRDIIDAGYLFAERLTRINGATAEAQIKDVALMTAKACIVCICG